MIDLSDEQVTKLKLLQGYKFNIKFDVEDIPEHLVDEPKPVGEGAGPSAPRLLATAVGFCLSTSLLYCLGKARIGTENLETTVVLTTERNEQGSTRVKDINVRLDLQVNQKDKARLPRCLDLFQKYCTVTESVRKGIPVSVKVDNL